MEKISEKSKLVVQTTALLLLLCLSIIAFQFSSEAKADTAFSVGVQNTSFSIVQITDTQHLADMYPQLFDNLTKWIAANVINYNVSMVVHTGDIVDYSTSFVDWQNANRSMTTLLSNGVPYLWTAGNHDQNPQQNPNATWLGSNYVAFNPAVMRSKPYWVSDLFNGKETAVQFSYGNYKFLIIDLEYFANSSAIFWMTNLITTHPDYNVIVGTHCLLNNWGEYKNSDNATWETDFVNTLNNYPNVFLTLNGHDHDVNFAARNQVGNRTQIYWDMQEVTNSAGATVGGASARIYSFDMNSKIVAASTYLVYNSTWLNDSQNSFVFAPVLMQSKTDPTVTLMPTPSPNPAPTLTPTSTPTPLPSLEPTPTDTPTSTDSPTPTPSPIPTSTPSPIPSAKPSPAATSSPQTSITSSTIQPRPTQTANLTPIPKSNSTLTTITSTPNNGATINLPFSGLSLGLFPSFSAIIILAAFIVVVVKEKRK